MSFMLVWALIGLGLSAVIQIVHVRWKARKEKRRMNQAEEIDQLNY